MFLISVRTEKQLSTGYGRWFWFWLILGMGVALGGAGIWSQLEKYSMGVTLQPYAVAAGGFMVVLVLGWVWTVYNSLVNLHHRVEQGWSQVDVQLKRRHDLIPNLVKTVEGYRTYESETQQVLTELRAQAGAPASPDSKGVTPMLRIMIERYPDLKANESFLRLQQALW